MNAQKKPSRLDAAADRLLSLDSVVYGDERQRRVVLEACSFGWTIGIYVPLGVAVVASALGHPFVSLVLLVVATIPALAAQWYGKRRQVDFTALAGRDRRLLRRTSAITMLILAAWCATLLYQGMTGHGLIRLSAPPSDLTNSVLCGMGSGGLLGGLVGGIWQFVAARRTEPRLEDGTEPDDEF